MFVAAIKNITAYRDRGKPLRAWRYGIARNVVADHQRKAGTERRYRLWPFGGTAPSMSGQSAGDDQSSLSLLADLPDLPDKLDLAADLAQRMDLRDALNHLIDIQRELGVLRFFVGLDTEEIARLMGKTAPAGYSLEARALVALRK